MGLRRRPDGDDEDEQSEKRRQGWTVMALLSLGLLLALLVGGVGYLELSTQPLRVGNYWLQGPNARRSGDDLLWTAFGSGQAPVAMVALKAPQLRNIAPGRSLPMPVRVTYVANPQGQMAYFVTGRLLFECLGIRLIGP